MAGKRKAPWAFVALAAIIGFVGLPVGFWYAKVTRESREYEVARLAWEQKFAALVEDRATIEEVKQAILAEGREVTEGEADEKNGLRRRVSTHIPEATVHGLYAEYLVPVIYFDEEGRAVGYKVD